jgi:hypothetical protein
VSHGPRLHRNVRAGQPSLHRNASHGLPSRRHNASLGPRLHRNVRAGPLSLHRSASHGPPSRRHNASLVRHRPHSGKIIQRRVQKTKTKSLLKVAKNDVFAGQPSNGWLFFKEEAF